LVEQGYAATTLDQIAHRAGVALPTLTGYFPNKPTLLQQVLRSVVTGPAEEREPSIGEQLRALLDIADMQELLAAVASLYRRANERAYELFEIMRSAAAADPNIEEQRQAGGEARRRDQTPLARHLKRRRALRSELTEGEATDILWLYSSADLYRLLVHESQWRPERYEQWLAKTLADALLDGRGCQPETNS
jgi:AcrR family transcriptional regulator